MQKTATYLLILILGIVIGAAAVFLFGLKSTSIQNLLCPTTLSSEEVWEKVEFPEYENPFEETTVNPFDDVKTNPFE